MRTVPQHIFPVTMLVFSIFLLHELSNSGLSHVEIVIQNDTLKGGEELEKLHEMCSMVCTLRQCRSYKPNLDPSFWGILQALG